MPAVSTPLALRCASVLLLLLTTACLPASPVALAVDDDREGTSGGTEPSSTSTTAVAEPELGSEESTTTAPGSSFIDDGDVGASFECDTFSQNCPAGHKCSPWADDGGSTWNGTHCVPVVPDPDDIGEPCTVEGSSTTGLDSCVLGAMCWDVDPETNTGVCREHCQGSSDDWQCSDPETRCGGPRLFPICLPLCCPIEQDCPTGEACYPDESGFSCYPDASGEDGQFRDGCQYLNVCDPGLTCLQAAGIPGCTDPIGCCAPFCTVGSTWCSLLDPAMDCLPWYDEHAPPGYELTGVCYATK